MSDWTKSTDQLPPDGMVVETKIDDKDGVRNETTLKRQGNLWFFSDDSMYVYYWPTHWRPISSAHRLYLAAVAYLMAQHAGTDARRDAADTELRNAIEAYERSEK